MLIGSKQQYLSRLVPSNDGFVPPERTVSWHKLTIRVQVGSTFKNGIQ